MNAQNEQIGKFVQNVAQGMARDQNVAQGMARDEAGYDFGREVDLRKQSVTRSVIEDVSNLTQVDKDELIIGIVQAIAKKVESGEIDGHDAIAFAESVGSDEAGAVFKKCVKRLVLLSMEK